MSKTNKLLAFLMILSFSFISALAPYPVFAKTSKKAQNKQEEEAKKEEMVYATERGKKYHNQDCRFIKNRDASAITKQEAVDKGLVPCGKCFKEESETQEAEPKE